MVIQPEFSIPFQLTFHQYERQWEITQFSPDPEVQLENVPEVVENLDFSITFQSEHSDARLYMDGLEVLSEREGIELDDQHRPYLPPEDKPYVIFKNTEDYYPLIPGHYRITVIINGDTYYSLFRVIPKQLSQEQWELMRDELEAELRGLALDLVRKHLGVGEALFEYIPPKKLFQFLIIRKRFDSIMASLSDLMTRVYFHTQKHYNLVPVDRARAIDQESVRYKLTHPEVQDSLKSPIRRIEYDLLENRWIKRILKVLSRHLEDIASSLMQYRDALAEELNESLLYFSSSGSKIPVFLREKQRLLADLQSFVVMAQKMCKGLQIIKLAAWFEQVGELVEPTVSPVLLYDPRYRSLYQLYRELQTESMEIVIDSHYAYQWKRTDQLFEIWGFLKLCRTLINQLGFEGVSGWLFDQEYFGGNLLVPTLLPETAIVLRRDDIQLKLVYNALIPSEQGAENHPIYMLGNFHNRPDGRLDFYQNETYIGTIIIDFKYRPRRGRYAFWNPAPRTASRRPAATNQLIAYRADSASRYLYGSHIDPRQREQIRPVLETWAIYPGYRQIEPETEYDSNHHVRLLQLTPGESNVHLKRELENAIANILRMFELYRGSSPSPVNS